ncbi:MAG TPA: FG-GAP repeat protein, partial [Thermoleophilia bacterium]|nr:FG-GAP repeat protein [Thermoleophilia bacterium]
MLSALFGCFAGPVVAAHAAPAGDSAQTLLPRLALQQGELIAPDGVGGNSLGMSVAVSGNTALVGAPYCDVAGNVVAGAAYVFVRSGGAWVAQAKLTAADGADLDLFGYSVALSGDTALIGAMGLGRRPGAAYVFALSAGSWTQRARLRAFDGVAGDEFGRRVALSVDTALIGAPGHDIAGKQFAGATYVFARFGASWLQQARLIAP